VQEAITKLGEIFWANMGYNPAHVPGSHTLHPALARQFKGMRNTDPGEKQHKALPVCVYREIYRMAYVNKSESSDLDVATADTLTLTFFFCMRSCKYSEVQGERHTKILCMRNIRFYNERNQDITNKIDELEDAVSVSLTFEFQKKYIRNETIFHQKSGDKLALGHMYPVKAAVNIVRRIHSYGLPSEKFPDTQINMVRSGSGFFTIPLSTFLQRIRLAVDTLGPEKLGFISQEVGTHSNRSGGTMGMFLAGTPIYTIMLIGRWSSDAFMRYIRKQVLQLSHGISEKMLT